MSKFWIFMGILFTIVLLVAVGCAVSDPFKLWFVDGTIFLFGGAAITVIDVWTGISANPIYQQWHMLIWFIGGIVGTVIFTKILWPRRSRLQQKQVTPQSYQHTMQPSTPQSVSEPVPQNIAKPEPEKEESVKA